MIVFCAAPRLDVRAGAGAGQDEPGNRASERCSSSISRLAPVRCRAFTAIVDHAKLGQHLEAFTELRFAPRTQVGDIDHALDELRELVE